MQVTFFGRTGTYGEYIMSQKSGTQGLTGIIVYLLCLTEMNRDAWYCQSSQPQGAPVNFYVIWPIMHGMFINTVIVFG